MLDKLKKLVMEVLQPQVQDEAAQAHQNELAAALLLVEVMQADYTIEDSERRQIISALQQLFQLSADEARLLSELAEQQHEDIVSLYDMTSIINKNFSEAEKILLLQQMWRIAYADLHLDDYEEHIIRRVADLIYVSHTDFIRAKLLAEEQSSL